MNSARVLAVLIALFAAAPAQAQVVDLSKTTCKEFLESGKDGIMIIWAWLYGYYADQDADPVVDFAKLTAQGTKLAEACKAAPTKDIITVAEPIYESK
jgi:acid stress chaperone HdeB